MRRNGGESARCWSLGSKSKNAGRLSCARRLCGRRPWRPGGGGGHVTTPWQRASGRATTIAAASTSRRQRHLDTSTAALAPTLTPSPTLPAMPPVLAPFARSSLALRACAAAARPSSSSARRCLPSTASAATGLSSRAFSSSSARSLIIPQVVETTVRPSLLLSRPEAGALTHQRALTFRGRLAPPLRSQRASARWTSSRACSRSASCLSETSVHPLSRSNPRARADPAGLSSSCALRPARLCNRSMAPRQASSPTSFSFSKRKTPRSRSRCTSTGARLRSLVRRHSLVWL